MKWLVIIAILVIIAVGMIWLRTIRQGSDAAGSQPSHRRDESLPAPGDADNPLPPGGTAVAGGATGGPPIDAPSRDTWASEEARRGEPRPGEDPPPSEPRPQA